MSSSLVILFLTLPMFGNCDKKSACDYQNNIKMLSFNTRLFNPEKEARKQKLITELFPENRYDVICLQEVRVTYLGERCLRDELNTLCLVYTKRQRFI